MNKFTKSDLKNRMIVETRNHNRYLVIDDKILSGFSYLFLNKTTAGNGYYNEDLVFINDLLGRCEEFDIVRVYAPVYNLSYLVDNEKSNLKLIWQRPVSIKEVTMAEVEEKFGCKVKIVKE